MGIEKNYWIISNWKYKFNTYNVNWSAIYNVAYIFYRKKFPRLRTKHI